MHCIVIYCWLAFGIFIILRLERSCFFLEVHIITKKIDSHCLLTQSRHSNIHLKNISFYFHLLTETDGRETLRTKLI